MKRLDAIGKSDGHGHKVRAVPGCPLWRMLVSLHRPLKRIGVFQLVLMASTLCDSYVAGPVLLRDCRHQTLPLHELLKPIIEHWPGAAPVIV